MLVYLHQDHYVARPEKQFSPAVKSYSVDDTLSENVKTIQTSITY